MPARDMNRIRASLKAEYTYVTKPCINGHDGRRYTETSKCVQCVKGWNVRRPSRSKTP